MVRFGAYGLITIGIIHLLVLGVDLPSEMLRWVNLYLWTFDHWAPVRSQPVDLALSGSIFWATIGSFAIPVILIGALVLHGQKRGWFIPAWLGWGLVIWLAVATSVMPPSGFPIGLVIALVLAIGLQRQENAA